MWSISRRIAAKFLRESHEHRRLGFSAEEVAEYLRQARLDLLLHRDLAPSGGEQDEKLTVSLWLAATGASTTKIDAE